MYYVFFIIIIYLFMDEYYMYFFFVFCYVQCFGNMYLFHANKAIWIELRGRETIGETLLQ